MPRTSVAASNAALLCCVCLFLFFSFRFVFFSFVVTLVLITVMRKKYYLAGWMANWVLFPLVISGDLLFFIFYYFMFLLGVTPVVAGTTAMLQSLASSICFGLFFIFAVIAFAFVSPPPRIFLGLSLAA